MGRKHFRGCPGSPRTECGCGYHSTSSSLVKVMDQLLMCLKAESSIVSTCEELSYPFRTHPELAATLDAAAKESGVALVGTGVNPGFVMYKLVVTLAAI